MSANELVLVRHGATQWSPAGRHTGTTDLPLSVAGTAQARSVGNWLSRQLCQPDGDFGRLSDHICSPMLRTRETASVLELAGAPRARVVGELAEFDYGEYEGLTLAEIVKRNPKWSIWQEGCPGGETFSSFVSRISGVVEGQSLREGRHLVTAHSHVLRVLALNYLGLDPALGRHFELRPGSVSVLRRDSRHARVVLWNLAPPRG